MSNLAKVFGVIAVLGSGAALVSAYMLVEKHKTAVVEFARLDTEYRDKQKTYNLRTEEVAKHDEELKTSTGEVAKATTALEDTKKDAAVAEKRVEDSTVALKASEERSVSFEAKSAELEKLWEGADPKEFNQKKAQLIDQVAAGKKQNEETQTKVVEADKVATNLRDAIIVTRTPAKSPGVRGRVITLNRTWNFAVLNIGSDDGIAANSTLFVYRNRELIGKLRISSVERKIAIGDVIPESTNASIQPGDEVFQ